VRFLFHSGPIYVLLCSSVVILRGAPMKTEELLLRAIHDQPDDDVAWAALADWLEEQADPRAELLRLDLALRRRPDKKQRPALEARLQGLLVAGVGPCVPTLTNSLGMRFALIPAATFVMGSPESEAGRSANEEQHEVTIERAFYLGTHLVTQGQWQAVMGANPSVFKGANRPVENVSWDECQAFCRQLGKRDGRRYRLPTEEEWEHACRAGTTTAYHCGPGAQSLWAFCWCHFAEGTRPRETVPVGTFAANAWGLYDMHGNVKEWCEDLLVPYPRPRGKRRSSAYGNTRVLRGGSWYTRPSVCRSACRDGWAPERHDDNIGCRLVLCRD
jgi:uncharacterized protein (TIGR02996 family)